MCAFPGSVTGVLLVAVRIDVVLAIGLIVIRSTALIVATPLIAASSDSRPVYDAASRQARRYDDTTV